MFSLALLMREAPLLEDMLNMDKNNMFVELLLFVLNLILQGAYRDIAYCNSEDCR